MHKIVFNNGAFAVAWGQSNDGQKHLAMRWNGDDDNSGSFPITSPNKYPQWFLLPQELTLPMVRGGSNDMDAGELRRQDRVKV